MLIISVANTANHKEGQLTAYEESRQRMMDRIQTPEEALAFMDQRLRNNDLPEEELLWMSGYFCQKFPKPDDSGFVVSPHRVPLGALGASLRGAEVFVG